MFDFTRFDTRHYPTVSAREGYGAWQPTYEDTVLDLMDLALLERVGCVPWEKVARAVDLGCGTGRTGPWLQARGIARIDGVDATPEMLASARERGLHERLLEADVRTTGLGEDTYDLAICCLVDEHLDRLAPLYTEASRLLRADGHFVLVGYHPFFLMATGMPTHFDHPERGPVAIETHLHLFEEHHAAARESGLVPLELHEGVVDDEWVRRKPSWEKRRDWPISFAWAFRAAC